MFNKKNHVGRPSNEELRKRKNKKLFFGGILIVFIILLGFYIFSSGDGNSNLLKNDTVTDNNGNVNSPCRKGFTYIDQSKTCEKEPSVSCQFDGYTYNSNTRKCEYKYYIYKCPNGYSKQGDGSAAICLKSKQVPTTTCTDRTYTYNKKTKKCENVDYKYTCPSGYQMIGGGSAATCQSKNGTKIPTTTCTDRTYTYNKKTKKCENVDYKYTCPSGYQMIGGGSAGTCQSKSGTKSCSKYNTKYGPKYQLSGKKCIYKYYAHKIPATNVYTCDRGGTKKGNECSIEKKAITIYGTTRSIKTKKVYQNDPKMKTVYKTASLIKTKKVYQNDPKMKTVYEQTSIIPVLKILYSNKLKYTCTEGERKLTKRKVKCVEKPLYEVDNRGKENDIIETLTKIATEAEDKDPYGGTYQDYFGLSHSNDWCAAFIWWLFNQDDRSKNLIVKDGTADGIVRESVKKGLGTWHEDKCYTDKKNIPTYTPKAGDLILFNPEYGGLYYPYPESANYSNSKDAYVSSHIGYIYEVKGDIIKTIEGNRSNKISYEEYKNDFCSNTPTTDQRINGYYTPNYNK